MNNMDILNHRTAKLALAMTLGLATINSQADIYVDSIAEQISGITDAMSSEGWVMESIVMSKLNENSEDSWNFIPTQGQRYRLVAVCDQDCPDIDLFIYDSRENLVDSDEQEDAMPVATISNADGNIYDYTVKMYSCTSEPCYYALGIYYQ
jgi:hypothetical protein